MVHANGHAYRLRDPYISIFGPSIISLQGSNDPNETSLSATLPLGNYTAYLSTWSLERSDSTGAFAPVAATLVSNPGVAFAVLNGTTTTISYEFATDGVIVTVGSGQVRVTVAVDEIGAVCTPFGDECPADTWCPPTELTGAARACVTEGSIATGERCAAPSDCVANTSCIDLGNGPVCTELCPGSSFGEVCRSGGTCQPAGAEYGVCKPVATLE